VEVIGYRVLSTHNGINGLLISCAVSGASSRLLKQVVALISWQRIRQPLHVPTL